MGTGLNKNNKVKKASRDADKDVKECLLHVFFFKLLSLSCIVRVFRIVHIYFN